MPMTICAYQSRSLLSSSIPRSTTNPTPSTDDPETPALIIYAELRPTPPSSSSSSSSSRTPTSSPSPATASTSHSPPQTLHLLAARILPAPPPPPSFRLPRPDDPTPRRPPLAFGVGGAGAKRKRESVKFDLSAAADGSASKRARDARDAKGKGRAIVGVDAKALGKDARVGTAKGDVFNFKVPSVPVRRTVSEADVFGGGASAAKRKEKEKAKDGEKKAEEKEGEGEGVERENKNVRLLSSVSRVNTDMGVVTAGGEARCHEGPRARGHREDTWGVQGTVPYGVPWRVPRVRECLSVAPILVLYGADEQDSGEEWEPGLWTGPWSSISWTRMSRCTSRTHQSMRSAVRQRHLRPPIGRAHVGVGMRVCDASEDARHQRIPRRTTVVQGSGLGCRESSWV